MQVLGRSAPARRLTAVTAAAALALGLAACGGDDSPSTSQSGSGDDQVTIRFSWWGSDTRQQVTQEVIDAFEAKYPHISVQPDYTSWDNYFEKLNVGAAGGDLPDVITQEERFLAEYANRGLLADLDELGLDTSAIDDAILDSGTTDDGLVGVASGVSVHAPVADPAAFEAAGVDLPDDTTWTWDDYEEVAAAISAGSDGEYYGVQDYSFLEVVLKIIARQNGEEVFTEDGEVGVSQATVASWFQRSLDLQASGGEPSASVSTEVQAQGVEGSLPATNAGAMAWFWSNQLEAIQSAAGRDLVLLRPPGEADAQRTGTYLKPTMYYSVAAGSDHPEEAALLVDFLINSTEAGELILADRGLPSNEDVREAILPLLSDADRVGAEFVTDISETVVDGTPVPPVGSGETTQITQRINSDLLFGRLTAEEAAKRWIDEVSAAIS
ncbi:ABC transporter substrate-binding protein [Cellulomonas triticagri]|uniref:Extracellular solute-binding protein n=1 Tax=Cellulomonas triticagri TaxID=2483352 RepID=A0A3M2J6C5_9CELL|nr:extracellular solute-binding protein [Cellulomonas triticagri]RMI09662.1 extracellular solute-binding protein [Cellulomonas triticagri]